MKKTMTLRNRFIYTSYLSIAFSIIFIIVISYVLLSNNSQKSTARVNEEVVRQSCDTISLQLNNLERTFRDIIYGPRLQELLRRQLQSGGNDSFEFRTSVNQTISEVTNALYMFDNVAVYSHEGVMLGSMLGIEGDKNLKEYPWFKTCSTSQGNTCWQPEYRSAIGEQKYMLPAIKKIRSLQSWNGGGLGDTLGYLYVLVNLDNVFDFSNKDYNAGGRILLILDEKGQVIGGSEKKVTGSFFTIPGPPSSQSYVDYQDEDYLMTWGKTGNSSLNWYVVCLTSKDAVLKEANMAISICFLVVLVLLAVFLMISIHNANALSRPILDLEHSFEMVEQGNFNIMIRKKTNIEELDRLFTRFHIMAYRLDHLIHEVYESQIKEEKLKADAKQAELETLQMQINPHFLYNTLDSINWMALLEGNEEVSRMILALGHLFRANMNTTGIHTTIREEAENLKLFMYLERLRFGDQLEYQLEIEEGVSAAKILKHLLQPLVENSIKYGIEPYCIRGRILVTAQKREDFLLVSVTDNGRGIKTDKLNGIRKQWEDRIEYSMTQDTHSGGVGLNNIMKRLYLYYGDQASFFIESSPEKGTRTVISYPYEEM